jgi:hypothetical protein
VRGNFGTFPLSKEAQTALAIHVKKYRSSLRRTHAEEQLPPSPGALEAARAAFKQAKGKIKEKASNGKQVSKVKKAKPQASKAAKRSKKEVSQSDKELNVVRQCASSATIASQARSSPPRSPSVPVKKNILDFFSKLPNK